MVDEPMSGTLGIVVTVWRSAVLQRSSSAVRYSPLEPDEGTCAALCHGMSEGGTGSDAGLVLTRLHRPRLLFLPWPSREVEVHHHRRMVAACRYALLVEVLDVPHDPMAADPDRIEATSRARRVLPPPTNQSTGQIVFANMQGGQFSGWGQATTPLSSDYLVKDAVDLFNNGHADVIVLQQSTGATYYAEEGANGFLQWGSVTSSLGPHWQAV